MIWIYTPAVGFIQHICQFMYIPHNPYANYYYNKQMQNAPYKGGDSL